MLLFRWRDSLGAIAYVALFAAMVGGRVASVSNLWMLLVLQFRLKIAFMAGMFGKFSKLLFLKLKIKVA